MAEAPRGLDVAIHCESGRRSEEAVKLLQKAGRTRVREVEGGILARAEIDTGVKPH